MSRLLGYNWLMKQYNWQQPDWPNFRYDISKMHALLLKIAEKNGVIGGKLSYLPAELQSETMINFMVEEAIKTSAIEGEYINRPDVRSSIKNQLGLSKDTLKIHDQRAAGLAELMIDIHQTFKEVLTETKLFDWHIMLFSSSTYQNLRIGWWRTHVEPMQIVSGYQHRQKIHYEAPPSSDVPKEMQQFIAWFNATAPDQSNAIAFAPVRAAIAHLYFESIHPFEDGNGRIGRAVAEKALLQGFGYPAILSLSLAIEANKKAYYAALHTASKSNEITDWVHYFLNVILEAQSAVEKQIQFVLKKSVFFDHYKDVLNERQLKVIRRMLQEGSDGFEGGMNARKYMAITGTSKATATRDLQDLLAKEIVIQIGSGRSIRYQLVI